MLWDLRAAFFAVYPLLVSAGRMPTLRHGRQRFVGSEPVASPSKRPAVNVFAWTGRVYSALKTWLPGIGVARYASRICPPGIALCELCYGN